MPNRLLSDAAERVLGLMHAHGFDGAQVTVSRLRRSEVCVAHNEPSLLRSSDSLRLQVVGLLDGRRADTDGTEIDDDSLAAIVQGLRASVASAPQDGANAVSSGQSAHVARGSTVADVDSLAAAMRELLAWRAHETPTLMIEEALAGHNHASSVALTSAGSALSCELGWTDAAVFGLAREGSKASSFNFAGGSCDGLAGAPFQQRFGLDEMMRALTRQIDAQPLAERFVGSVVLTPRAVTSLLGWLLGQLADQPLIDGSSVYRESVGQPIASPLLTLKSRFDAPGVSPLTADAHLLQPVTLLADGCLTCLTPSLYASRKTGIAHVPVSGEGWELAAGSTPLATMIAGVPRGALVDRLSMGRPAANGDFSGVIKNSFAIRDGAPGAALSETMISGNVAQMLRDVQAVSRERIDSGGSLMPWLRVDGLHFS